MIAGEALTAVGIAGFAAVGIQSLGLAIPPAVVTATSLLAAAGLVFTFVRQTRPSVESLESSGDAKS